jgi:polysaccharide export outer membrane protein
MRARLSCVFSLLLLLALAPPAHAQSRDRTRPKETGTADRPAARDPDTGGNDSSASYRVGAGDVLNVEVVGRKDLSGQYTVGQDGVLFMPLTGGVTADGRTAPQLAAELARRLSLYDRDITQVNVSVAEFKSRKIFVMGGVVNPGKYSFPQKPTVWDAISEAGGPTEDAQLQAVEVIPGDPTSGGTHTVDVAAAIREGRVQSMERLKPGDTVRVPKGLPGAAMGTTGNSIYMFGAIARPGPVLLDKQIDLMSAIAQSGGPTADADLKSVQIVRRNGTRVTRMKVNLNDYINHANVSANPNLYAGDTVILGRQGSGGLTSALRILTPIVGLTSAIVLIVRK